MGVHAQAGGGGIAGPAEKPAMPREKRSRMMPLPQTITTSPPAGSEKALSARSWLGRLRDAPATRKNRAVIGAGETPLPVLVPPPFSGRGIRRPRPKPVEEIADWLLMSTLDEKAPPETAGSADLLDSLVRDELARSEEHSETLAERSAECSAANLAEGREELHADALPADHAFSHLGDGAMTDPEAPAMAPGMSEEERTRLLQKEIDSLLKDTVPAAQENFAGGEPMAAAAIAPPAALASAAALATAPASATPAPANTPGVSAAESASAAASRAAGASAEVSREELDALLADQAGAMAPEPLSGAPAAADPQAEQKLSEAEGLLAEELTQLMAQGGGAPAAAATASAVEGPTPSTSAVVAAADAPPGRAAPVPAPASPLPLSQTAGENVPAAASPAGAESAKPASAAAGTEASPLRPRRVLFEVMLLLAQVLDFPFSWMREPDKNVIGISALLLLLGGVVLWGLARIMGG